MIEIVQMLIYTGTNRKDATGALFLIRYSWFGQEGRRCWPKCRLVKKKRLRYMVFYMMWQFRVELHML